MDAASTPRMLLMAAALAAVCCAALPANAALGRRAAGSGFGDQSIYATDAYPGFDGLDKLPVPEKKEKSWFLSVSRGTPAEHATRSCASGPSLRRRPSPSSCSRCCGPRRRRTTGRRSPS